MNTPDSAAIVMRFFQALQRLKEDRRIRGKQTFTARHGINRWNMNSLEKDPSRDIFQPAWLAYLVEDYGVSPRWLLTGTGDFYDSPGAAPKPQSKRAKRPRKPSPINNGNTPQKAKNAPLGNTQNMPDA